MSLLKTIKKHLSGHKKTIPDTDPVKAYNLWSDSYDAQPDNLMLKLEDQMFSGLLSNISLKNKKVIDVGCGTGRNWNKILLQQPLTLTGYDVSPGMLNKLIEKFPDAVVWQMESNDLPGLENNSCDVIISTLALAHIEHIEEALTEWHRVLKNQGEVLITDYHPQALMNGADRTFKYNGQTIAVRNYVHEIYKLFELLLCLGFELLSLEEKKIDLSMKSYYEEKQALHVFEKFNNVPIIYSMHLKKKNDIT